MVIQFKKFRITIQINGLHSCKKSLDYAKCLLIKEFRVIKDKNLPFVHICTSEILSK